MLLVAAGLLVTGVASVHAGPFEDGVAAFRRGDYVAALSHWARPAMNGHAASQYNIGIIYRDGLGVPQDFVQSTTWFRRAAEQGDVDAQLMLGTAYALGRGVTKDRLLAYMWLDLAASQGDNKARVAVDLLAREMLPDQIAEAERMAGERRARLRR